MPNIRIITQEEAEGKLKEIYEDLLQKRGKLADVHLIHSLNPESLVAHMELYLTVMFSHSPLSRAQREMIAVVVSSVNDCVYCQEHHGAALLKYWKDEERVQKLKRNYRSAGLSSSDEAICRFAIDLTLHPDDFGSRDQTQLLREAGLDDRGILDTALVVGYFNFVNRLVLALGVQPEENAGQGFNY